MDNMLNVENVLSTSEMVSYFFPLILCLIAIVANLVLFIFFKRKNNTNRLCDCISIGALLLNIAILIVLYFKNFNSRTELTFCVFNNLLVFDGNNILSQILINLFFVAFILITYKLTRKTRFKLPLLNSNLLLLNIFSNLLVMANNSLFAFLLLEVCTFLIYKYGSISRIKKYNRFSYNFILISSVSTILFFAFYLISLLIKDVRQLEIVQVCISLAILLKAGLFPVYNYTVGRKYKNNLPWATLSFVFLPLCGAIAFFKFITEFENKNEPYWMTLFLFCIILCFAASLNAFKSKNLTRFLANSTITFVGVGLLTYMASFEYSYSVFYLFKIVFLALAVCALFVLLKLNLNTEKLNVLSLKNIFVKNRFFAGIFSLVMLAFVSCFPTAVTLQTINNFNYIYAFDKYGSIFVFVILVSYVLILLNILKMIKNIYNFDKTNVIERFKKGTIFNYIVPCVIFLFLFLKTFF